MESFETTCPNCGPIDHSIDYYSHDEFSWEDTCETCGANLPNVDKDGMAAVRDAFADQADAAYSRLKDGRI
jgi:hypothetical protein